VSVEKKRRLHVDRCASCGGTQFVPAVDNYGNPYPGCIRCVLVDSTPPLRARGGR
jgi:hypothetical protein